MDKYQHRRRDDGDDSSTRVARKIRDWGQTIVILCSMVGAVFGSVLWVTAKYQQITSDQLAALRLAARVAEQNNNQDDALVLYGRALTQLIGEKPKGFNYFKAYEPQRAVPVFEGISVK